jgi:hypothetical protein
VFANIAENRYIGRADLVVRRTRPALTTTERMRFDMAIPTQARLRELFNYDPISGLLVWKDRDASQFKTKSSHASFVARCAGRPAGHIEAQGYRVVLLDGTQRKAHKLIWLLVYGEWVKFPEAEIDHLNGDRADNRISNLRKTTKSANQRNGSMRSNNTSGVMGVNWVASKSRWVARIWDGPRHRYLGQFRSLEDARQARIRAERELGYHEGHGKQSSTDRET